MSPLKNLFGGGKSQSPQSLNRLDDRRPGVGLRADGIPDIEWVFVPDEDPTGRREFIYGDMRRGNFQERTEPDFWIARYPITYRQFQAFLDTYDGFHNEHWWEALRTSQEHRERAGEQCFKYWDHPRETVSWYDAIAFCRWLTAKAQERPDLLPSELDRSREWRITLPTEWQWEKAARGHDGRLYPWGDQYKPGHANVDEPSSGVGPNYMQKTTAVGMYPHIQPDDSPYGVADLSGNVWEWCLNEYAVPEKTNVDSTAERAVRGGSWGDYHIATATHFRNFVRPDNRVNHLGFRVVVTTGPRNRATC